MARPRARRHAKTFLLYQSSFLFRPPSLFSVLSRYQLLRAARGELHRTTGLCAVLRVTLRFSEDLSVPGRAPLTHRYFLTPGPLFDRAAIVLRFVVSATE